MSAMEVWDEPPVDENDETDGSTLAGAQRLAEKINEVWAAKGVKANARPARRPFHPTMRGAFYTVETDLGADGLPPAPAPRGRR